MAAIKVGREVSIYINDKQVINSFRGITNEMSKTRNELNNLNKGSETYDQDVKRLKTSLQELTVRQQNFKKELNEIPGILGRIHNMLGPVAVGILSAFSITSIVAGFTSKLKEAWSIVVDFNQKQADLAAIMQKSRVEISKLTADAMKYGSTTSYTSSQVSILQTELARLGKTEKEIRAMTKGVLEAATALETELGPAAQLIGGQLNSYQANASEAGRFSDIMANSVNISATSFESLATALPKVSKVAYLNNVSFEKLNATLGVLADESIAAETAGTSFRNILLIAAEAGKPYEKMLEYVANATDKTRKATELFGKQNATAAVIMATSQRKIEESTKMLENSTGSAATLAKTKLDSLEGAVKLFSSAWEGFILSVEKGDGIIAKTFRNMIDFGSSILSVITPTRELSDDLRTEQIELNKLVSKITSTNVSNEERTKLLKKLKEEYPSFLRNINIETISNDELKKNLRKVNDEYRDRILLQKQVERLEKVKNSRDKYAGDIVNKELDLFDKLTSVKVDLGLNVDLDYNQLEKSAKLIQDELKKRIKAKKGDWGMEYDVKNIDLQLEGIKKIQKYTDKKNKDVEKEQSIFDQIQKQTGRITEEEKERLEILAEQIELMKTIRTEAKALGMKNVDTSADDEVKQWVLAYKERLKYSELSEKDKEKAEKKRQKKIDAERKAYEKACEAFEKGEKEIDDLITKTQEDRALNQKKGLDREIAQIDLKYSREKEKYKEHTSRLKDLEVLRIQEIEDLKVRKIDEFNQKNKELENEIEAERAARIADKKIRETSDDEEKQLLIIDKSREAALLDITLEEEKELAKLTNIENVEDLKNAIIENACLKRQQIMEKFAEAEKNINTKKVKWTEISEEQKLNAIRFALNSASEAVNENSTAWKAIKISEATIATYQSAVNSYNALAGIIPNGPVLGGIAAAAAVVSGLKNVAMISKTKIDRSPKFYDGGSTGNIAYLGHDQYGKVTGLVHDDEYVIPKVMTQNPRYANVISWIEAERTQKLNRFYDGGSTSSSNFINPVLQENIQFDEMNKVMLSVLYRLENPITPQILFGYEDAGKIKDLQTEKEQSQNNGKL